MATDWSKLTVVDLRAELKRRGLDTKGVKAALVERLEEADGGDKVEEPPSEEAPAASEVATPVADGGGVAVAKPDAPVDPTPNPQSNGGEESQEPSVPPTEVLVDEKKRKRRSVSPPPSNLDTPRKRPRQDPAESLKTEGTTKAAVQEDAATPQDLSAEGASRPGAAVAHVASSQPPPSEAVSVGNQPQTMDHDEVVDYGDDSLVEQHDAKPEPAQEVAATKMDVDTDVKKHGDGPTTSDRSKRDIRDKDDSLLEPARHPATDSLYIGNLMRPLRTESVEDHLIELASAQGEAPHPSVIKTFFLDSIRTHVLVQFSTVAAASRVRSALHGRVWPDERNRKKLWVDYVPSGQVRDWIDKEEAEAERLSSGGGSRGGAPRWEVVYHKDGSITVATHQIAAPDSKAPPTGPAASRSGVPANAPTGPAAREHSGIGSAPSGPRSMQPMRAGGGRPGGGGGDMRANSYQETRATPSLSWQSVSPELARRRLANLDQYVSHDPARDVSGDHHRYSFTRSDQFIDRGPETFVGIRPPFRDRRGPMGGGGGGGGGGPRGGGGGLGGGNASGSGSGSHRAPLPPQSFEAPPPRRRGGRRRHGGGPALGPGGRFGEGGRFGDGRPPRYEDFRYRPGDNDRSDRR